MARAEKKSPHHSSTSVRFSLRAKLIIIVTALLLVSLGLITSLVAFFVSRDVEETAWATNESINEMSAAAADVELNAVISKASVMLADIATYNADQDLPEEDGGEFARFFFRENMDIAAVVTQAAFDATTPMMPLSLRNDQFFLENNISPAMIDAFLAVQRRAFERANAGETTLLNAAPVLNGLPILTLFFKWQNGQNSALCALFFSSESITTAFGTGTNSTMLINAAGDVLVSAESELVSEGINVANRLFIDRALESGAPAAMHERYTDRQGREFFATSKRLEAAGAITVTTIPVDVVFEGITTTTWRNIYLSAGVWFLSVLFLWFFAKSISQPLRELTAATHAIEDGDYHLTLENKQADETGVLTKSVLSMSSVLENFESFTNKEIARLARQGKLDTSGSKKRITMFFSDIRSFTAISEKITPNEVIEFLNEYMERMVACVMVTGGAIDKFIGDAVMAYWGAVTTAGSAEEDALSGVKASLLMRASLKCFNKTRGGDKNPVIKIGCGLNSGDVVAGQIGSSERIVFTVIGEVVNLADRTETLNKPFGTEILITEHTQRLVDKYVITEKMGEITEKGEKISIFAVVNLKDGEESEKLLALLEKIPHIDQEIARRCIGPQGPRTVAEVRTLLDIPTPDLSNLNLDEEEKKYSVKEEPPKAETLEALESEAGSS